MKVKKTLLLAAFTLFAASGMAQTEAPAEPASNAKSNYEFVPHWFIQAQGGIAETRGEIAVKELLSPTAALNVGYRFTPVVGVRVGASGWQAKGSYVPGGTAWKYNYVQGNVDAVFDLSALVCKFNPKRVFNLYAFLGAGVNYSFNNDEAVAINDGGYPLQYLWRDNRVQPVGRGGLGVNFRLADHVAFNIEGNVNITSDHFNSKKAGNPDWQFNVLAGFTFSLGKTYKVREVSTPPAPVVEPEVVEEPVVKPEPKPEPKPEVKPTMTRNVFFLINSSKVRTSEEAKVDELVSFMKENPKTTVTITGYADAGTGSQKYNQQISQWRSQAVADMMIKKGISSDRITVNSKGDTVQPFSANDDNRVSVCVAE